MTDARPSFPSGELVMRALLRRELSPDDPHQVGRDLLGTIPWEWYVRIETVTGGRGDQIQGDIVLDIEVFDVDYLAADSRARDIEGLLLGYPHVVEVDGQTVVIDSVSGGGPSEIPWDDPAIHRILATYVITVRR